MNLEPGKPYSTQLLTKDRDQIMATYLDKGFLNVTFKSKVEHTKDDPIMCTCFMRWKKDRKCTQPAWRSIGAQHTRPEIRRAQCEHQGRQAIKRNSVAAR